MHYYLLAMAAPTNTGTQASGGGLMTLFPILLMVLIFWLMIIRPQAKKQRELTAMLATLKEDDEVLTTSGMYGKVVSLRPDKDIVIIEIDDNNHTRVRMQRGAVATILKQ
jgi:preprotein translocase subunit YajC